MEKTEVGDAAPQHRKKILTAQDTESLFLRTRLGNVCKSILLTKIVTLLNVNKSLLKPAFSVGTGRNQIRNRFLQVGF